MASEVEVLAKVLYEAYGKDRHADWPEWNSLREVQGHWLRVAQAAIDWQEKQANAEIDTSDIPEITDWSKAERGKFYRGQPKVDVEAIREVADDFVPPGWRVIATREPRPFDFFLTDDGRIGLQDGYVSFEGRKSIYRIVERIEEPHADTK